MSALGPVVAMSYIVVSSFVMSSFTTDRGGGIGLSLASRLASLLSLSRETLHHHVDGSVDADILRLLQMGLALSRLLRLFGCDLGKSNELIK